MRWRSDEIEGSPCFRAPSPARMKEISLESTMWFAPSSRRNRTPEILCPLRGPFSQASLKPWINKRVRWQRVEDVCKFKSLHGLETITVCACLFNGWYKLLWDVGSNSLIFKLQLGVLLVLHWLKDSNNFTILPRATALLLMGEVKPMRNARRSETKSPFSQYFGECSTLIVEKAFYVITFS